MGCCGKTPTAALTDRHRMRVRYLGGRSGRQQEEDGGNSYDDISAHELGHEFPADVRLQFQSIVVE